MNKEQDLLPAAIRYFKNNGFVIEDKENNTKPWYKSYTKHIAALTHKNLYFAAKCFNPPVKTHCTSSQRLTHSFRYTTFIRSPPSAFCQASFPNAQNLIPRAWTTPTLQGNKVSLRLSRQVDVPNQRSSANKAIYVLCSIGTPALPFGCFVALRSLSHSFLSSCFRSGSYLCPSPHFIHYVLRSATITPRS